MEYVIASEPEDLGVKHSPACTCCRNLSYTAYLLPPWNGSHCEDFKKDNVCENTWNYCRIQQFIWGRKRSLNSGELNPWKPHSHILDDLEQWVELVLEVRREIEEKEFLQLGTQGHGTFLWSQLSISFQGRLPLGIVSASLAISPVQSRRETVWPKVCAQSLSCLTLCDPMDCSLPGSSVHGTLQARILEWVAISSSKGSSWPKDWTHISCIGRQVLLPPNYSGSFSQRAPSITGSLCHMTVNTQQCWAEWVAGADPESNAQPGACWASGPVQCAPSRADGTSYFCCTFWARWPWPGGEPPSH